MNSVFKSIVEEKQKTLIEYLPFKGIVMFIATKRAIKRFHYSAEEKPRLIQYRIKNGGFNAP